MGNFRCTGHRGKTHTLSYLAAKLILEGRIESDQEILIVTLVNSRLTISPTASRVLSNLLDYLKTLATVYVPCTVLRTILSLRDPIWQDYPRNFRSWMRLNPYA